MTRGHVLTWSYDANGNIMDRAHMNPILDTRTYQVEFTEEDATELTANVLS